MAGAYRRENSLSSASINEIKGLATWLETAYFISKKIKYHGKDVHGIFLCQDREMDASLRPLLTAMVVQNLN
jgi:hypothetical protein